MPEGKLHHGLILRAEPEILDLFLNLAFENGATGAEDHRDRENAATVWFGEETDARAFPRLARRYAGELESLRRAPVKLELETVSIPAQDWNRTWKEHWRPYPVGRGLLVVPAWLEPPGDNRRHVLRIDPKMAFGTGTHATTQLLLEWLEELPTLTQVLDMGCGTGILALYALKLGAQFALGLDNDPEAVANARENARLNGLHHNSFFRLGTVGDLGPEYRFPLVLANINSRVILTEFDALVSHTAANGILLITGLLEKDLPALRERAAWSQVRETQVRRKDEWVAVGFHHVPPGPTEKQDVV